MDEQKVAGGQDTGDHEDQAILGSLGPRKELEHKWRWPCGDAPFSACFLY